MNRLTLTCNLLRQVSSIVKVSRKECPLDALSAAAPAGAPLSSRLSPRASGSSLLGSVPWGAHVCHFYESKRDLLDLLVPYFAAGLKNGEACLWLTSAPLTPTEAERALSRTVPALGKFLKSGQMTIAAYSEWCGGPGRFDLASSLERCLEKESWALANGYHGLREAGNAPSLGGGNNSAVLAYEHAIDEAIGGHRAIAVCSYPLGKCALPDLIEVLDTHEFALIKSLGEWRKVAGGRRRAMAALRESEARYRALFNASPDGILISDPKTRRMLYANAAVCRMFGYTMDEMLALRVEDLHPEAAWPELSPRFKVRSRGKDPVPSIPCVRKNREIFYADISPAQASIDGRSCSIGIFRDITDRLKAEADLKRTYADLKTEKKQLEEKNIALREAMSAVEAEKNKFKDEVIVNVNKIVLPILKRMRLKGGGGHLDLLEKSLQTLISSFGRKLTEKDLKLTPKEIEISNMVRAGLTTKEIAGLLNASVQTVDKHRNNIRRKLGLSNKGVNLVSFLQSL